MKKFVKNKLKDQKGMTLIELLAVIVIIAIIAAIAIPAIGNIIENSRVGAIKSDAQNALAAANIYYTDNADADSGVAVSQLLSDGYLDDVGSLNSASTIATPIEADEAGAGGTNSLSISGSGYTGGVSITFTNATNDMISDVENGDEDGDTGVVINRDASEPSAGGEG